MSPVDSTHPLRMICKNYYVFLNKCVFLKSVKYLFKVTMLLCEKMLVYVDYIVKLQRNLSLKLESRKYQKGNSAFALD